ncbi:hypothetical protein ACWEQ7_20295 [Streptomyces sp. NPDC004069]
MDAEEARRNLDEARQSLNASLHPRLPNWAPPTCGVLLALGIALAGYSPSPGWLKLVAVAAGALLAVTAAQVVLRIRARQGVTGLRGTGRQKRTAVIASAAAFLVCALAATPNTRWIYAGLGLVVGVYTWFALRKQARP